ncbi:MAG TPA: polymer-forming cytoskeletal protein [Thiomicrorhabdus sp.]|nr:polymer-forming cytoskeletal protein [Thiomicrorhabdus sp.]
MGFFKSSRRESRQEGGKTIIAKGCTVTGELCKLAGALHVDGRVDGVIESDHDLSIGQEGCVTGLVKAKKIVLSGVFEGKMICESIEVLSTGKLIGELVCNEFVVETGGKFIGQSHEMTEGGMVVSLPDTFEKLSKTAMKSLKSEPSNGKDK